MSRAAGSFEHNGDQARDSTASGLLDAAKQMDAQAWRELVGRYSWLVFQWCCNAGLNADDAADVVQTVLAQVAVALPNFEKDGKKAAFRRWLRTITRRRIADFYRADAKQPHAEGGSAAEQRILAVADALSSSSSDAPERDALRSRLWRLLDRLEEETEESTWQAFWLTTVENQTSIEAATLLGMTPNAVRLARGRVLQRLREEAALPETDLPELRG